MSSSDNGTGNHDPCFDVASRIGHVDVIFLFDVLLHQANPSWATVLSLYYLWDDRKHVVSNLSYNLFEKSGHFPMVEEQELFDKKLLEWISTH
jgi:hypothetical protein